MEVDLSEAQSKKGPNLPDNNELNTNDKDVCIDKVMASSSNICGSLIAFLHPLVIMNVSEHWTRLKAQEGSQQQVLGALIGKQNGRNIEIMNSFELLFDKIENDIIIDRVYYNQKEAQFKQVFPDLDFLGWYTIGNVPTEGDIKVHKQLCEINESPVLLKLNPLVNDSMH